MSTDKDRSFAWLAETVAPPTRYVWDDEKCGRPVGTTTDPWQARRFATRDECLEFCTGTYARACLPEMRPVEHGFIKQAPDAADKDRETAERITVAWDPDRGSRYMRLQERIAAALAAARAEGRAEGQNGAWRKEPPTEPGWYWMRLKDGRGVLTKIDIHMRVKVAEQRPEEWTDIADIAPGEWAPCVPPGTAPTMLTLTREQVQEVVAMVWAILEQGPSAVLHLDDEGRSDVKRRALRIVALADGSYSIPAQALRAVGRLLGLVPR